ncbi:hypothetical protein ITP53_07250 [Nonomuraea sp. K274]|uniref:Uncharacterized protein n=1 Tax=Nonomuraea cypriaca TaxID=1187855 RepID=A0A931A5T8_9ACTN|nr:hypothetical protein [Nonomuraea cypriaca]MBF8185535.1 hypothetical protein [Nonomuraea cypriaca]
MAGTIGLSPDKVWTSAGWLFDWTVRFIAREVDDPRLTAAVDEILRENLGLLDLDRLPVTLRATVLRKLRDDLVPTATATLPDTVPERQEVLNYLGGLAQLARELSDP